MRDRGPRVARFFVFGVTAVACAVACGTAFPPGTDDGTGNGMTGTVNCSSPGHAGCPCSSAGESAACGDVVEKSGSYVTCSMGHSTCDGSKWGACVGHDLVVKSLHATSLGSGGLRFDSVTLQCADAGPGGSSLNPCDPNPGCTDIIGQPSDVDAGNESGLLVTEGGISLGSPNDAAPPVTCSGTGLACSVHYCSSDAGSNTTVSGTVYDPAGNNPLYNVIVYIPNDPTGKLTPFPTGVQCSQCASAQSLAASLNAVTATYTDVYGHFFLKNAPDGTNIPIVVQSGKWRRELLLSTVTKCAANVIPAAGAAPPGAGSCTWNDPTDATACQLHLPRNQFDGYDYVKADGSTYGRADMPQIALVSGAADPLECILVKAGIDPFEIGSYDLDVAPKTGHHHVHYFQSDQAPGASLDPAYGTKQKGSVLWFDKSPATLAPPHYDFYDLVMLPCEGSALDKHNIAGAPASGAAGEPYANLVNYTDIGGRLFTTHYGYTWLQYPATYVAGPDNWGGLAGVADWIAKTGTFFLPDPSTGTILTGFPKGLAFSQWLTNVGASATLGSITLHQAREDLTITPDVTFGGGAQPWMTAPDKRNSNGGKPFDAHFTYNTPYNAASAANQCGRVVYSDFHVSAQALVGSTNQCTAVTDPLGRTSFQGCGYGQDCVCGSPATVANCSPAVNGSCSEPCGTNSDCADTSYTCTGANPGACTPGYPCTTSACTPTACTQNMQGFYVCPGGGNFNCDKKTHLCVCKQDSDCPTGAKCVDNGQCFGNNCSGKGAYDGSSCTLNATCTAANCQGTDEACGAATTTCALAGHVCSSSNICACSSDADCPTDGKCVNDPTVNNCGTTATSLAACTGMAGSAVDAAQCTTSTSNTCFSNTDCGGATSLETCKAQGTCSSLGNQTCTPLQGCLAATCTKDSDCDSKQCLGGTCVCVKDADCPSGKCIDTGQKCHACTGAGLPDVAFCTGAAVLCQHDSDCNQTSPGSTRYQCSGGTCAYKSGGACTDDLDCPPGNNCLALGNVKCAPPACTGAGYPDSASCVPKNGCASNVGNPCRGSDGNDVETCKPAANYACPLGAGYVCSNTATPICLCSTDTDCESGKCINATGNCPIAATCTGTGNGDSASCVPFGTKKCSANSDCTKTSSVEHSICANPQTCGPVACGTGQGSCPGYSKCDSKNTKLCLCYDDSDCPGPAGLSGACVPSASNGNCKNHNCSGSGPADKAGCQLAGAPSSCTDGSQCGGAEQCTNAANPPPALGQCDKTCASSSDCTGHEQCSMAGGCDDCTKNADCTSLAYQATCVAAVGAIPTGKCCAVTTEPPPPHPSPGANAADGGVTDPANLQDCSLDPHDFPGSCAQAPLTAQEKALEFMFFDITSCVQPDQGPPPPPPPPPLTAQTFPLDFQATCGDAGAPPRWRELDFTATFPSPANGAAISIAAQTGPNAGSLVPATPLPIVTNDQTTGSTQVLLDTGGGYADAGASGGTFSHISPPLVSSTWLHLLVTLTPTADGLQSPTLVSWNVIYDCPPTE